jgi:hypothetical protein
MTTTTFTKTACRTCVASITGKCPEAVQLSLYCPKQPGKPIISHLKKHKKQIVLQLFTVEKN